MRKLLLILSLCAPFLLGGWGPKLWGYEEIRQTWIKEYNVETWKVSPLYGGHAVLMNDTAGYWIKGKDVYASNGAALSLSPGLPKSPPSVGQTAVEKAVNGQAVPMPKFFTMTYTAFIEFMLQDLGAYGFKKSIWSQYEAPGVEFHVKEVGRMLTLAGMSYRYDKDNTKIPAMTMIAIMQNLAPNLTTKEIEQTLKALLANSVAHMGTTIITEQDGVTFSMTSKEMNGNRYTELTATP